MRPTAMTTTLPRIWDTSRGCAVTLGTVYRYDLGTLWGPEHASEVRYVNTSQPESYGPHLMTREQLLENLARMVDEVDAHAARKRAETAISE
ncbi:MAG: hypothetical protein ACAH81_13510 [Actinomycetota bacterium]